MLKPERIARRAVLGREDGIAMMTVLMLTIILTVIGVAAITSTSLDIKMAGGERLRESTLNAAEACMSSGVQIIQQTLQNGGVPGTLTAAGANPSITLPLGASQGSITALRQASRASGRSREGEQAMTGKFTRKSMLGASCVWILIGTAVLLWSPMAEAQGTFSQTPQVRPTQPAKIDRSLPGSKRGTLTRAKGGTVWIDGVSYVLAPDALVEDKSGYPFKLRNYRWDGVAYHVQY